MLLERLDYLRVLTFESGLLRLFLAVVCGGLIGLERGNKGRAAGFRTYMIVCMGASLTMMLGQYQALMSAGPWAEALGELAVRTDVSRFGAQVINGIGFLGAGTIIVIGNQKVKGVTTAAGLWASACMGLAIGAGFYECVMIAFVLIWASFRLLPWVEDAVSRWTRDMNVYLEFDDLSRLEGILEGIKAMQVQVYDVDLDDGRDHARHLPSAVLCLRLSDRQPHARVLAGLSKLPGVRLIDEV